MVKQRVIKSGLLLCAVILLTGQAAVGGTVYVDAGATGSNDGSSWTNAFNYLQDALDAAVVDDEIQVAAGTYCPDMGNGYTAGDREASFELKNLVRILGGFPAGGGDRDIEANVTVLSGDLLQNDNPETAVEDLLNDPCRADNSYHVIFGELCGSPTLLDGLIIADGQANGADTLSYGGGWYNITNSSPTLQNCVFTHNAASQRGGGWFNEGANCRPTLTGVTFTVNYCANRGGAAAMLNTGADATLEDCLFSQNRTATHGGSLYLDRSSPTLLDCVFSGDYATNGGSLAGVDTSAPAITNTSFTESSATSGGAIWLDNCQAKFYDNTFTANSATSGGAIYLNGTQNWLNNCTFEDNVASNGGAIYSKFSTPQITRCLFFKNSSTSQGGALYSYSGHPKLFSSKFIGNYSVSHGGAICNQASQIYGHAYLTGWDCLFDGNYVTNSGACGGAIASLEFYWYYHNWRYTYVEFINSTFHGNTAVNVGGGLYTNTNSSTNTLRNCILYGNADTAGGNYSESAQIYGGTNTIQYSCVQGLSAHAGNGNIGDDPMFVDPDGPDWIYGTLDDDLRLLAGSPCIDAGDSTAVPVDITTDLDGNPRFYDDPFTVDTGVPGDPCVCVDMGAYEFTGEGGPVYFADANLKAAVEEALGVVDPTAEDMLALEYLDAGSKGIIDLTGLEYATNLITLKLNSNSIVDITPLGGLIKLESLLIYTNDIVDMSAVSDMENMTYLHISYNEIEVIPDLSKLTKLEKLYLHRNNISDVCPLAIPELTAFTHLTLYGNDPLSYDSYATCIPQIEENNPGLIVFSYDPNCQNNLASDANDDCIINIEDFAIMASEWLVCDYIYQDLCPY